MSGASKVGSYSIDRDRCLLVWRVALAALLHDVGKFAQRAEADPERYRTLANLHEFAVTDSAGNTRYHHAAYTWQFLEDHVPWLASIGERDDNVAVWAARHHRPGTPIEHVVAEADRLSAGMDRGEAQPDEALRGWDAVRTARLTPLLSRVRLDAKEPSRESDDGAFCIPLRELRPDETIFPIKSGALSVAEATEEYRTLFVKFCDVVETLPGRGHDDSIGAFFHSFLTAYERFAWCIPAATNTTPRDVSLFEHSRVAAAIAAALAAELVCRDGLTTDAVRNRDETRYVLAVGDLFGIQKFLYTITSRRAARALRGRSFFLQLIADAVGNRLLDALGLPPSNLLYCGGGKIWLLAPASARELLYQLADEIDLWIDKTYGGRLGFALGAATLAGRDFLPPQCASGKLEEATRDLFTRRSRRFSRIASSRYEEIFAPFGDPDTEELCHVCGRLAQDVREESDERPACGECRELELLGRLLPTAEVVVRIRGNVRSDADKVRRRLGGKSRYVALEGLHHAYLIADTPVGDVAAAIRDERVDGATVLQLNAMPEFWNKDVGIGVMFAGQSRASETFDDLVEASIGVKRLGVVRMDVDSLGDIFARGFIERERTLSRITNLSKSLAYFFGGVVSTLVDRTNEEQNACLQLIYSGGDDLFVVGAWSHVLGFSRELRRKFGQYVGNTSAWGLSGGATLIRVGQPIAMAARESGDLEHFAKLEKRVGGTTKDALAMFGEVLAWSDLDVVGALANEIVALTMGSAADSNALLPGFASTSAPKLALARGWIHRLSLIGRMYADSRAHLSDPNTRPVQEVEAALRRGRWAWQAAYAMARLGNPTLWPRMRRIVDSLPTKNWETDAERLVAERDLIGLLGAAATVADLLTRKEH